MLGLFDTLQLTWERLWLHRILVLWVLLGISVATTLALSLPLYVDSVYSEVLSSRLGNPPYAFSYRYLGAWNGNISRGDVDTTSAVIQQQFPARIGLPTAQIVRYVRGGQWTVRLPENNLSLGPMPLATLEGVENQITISQGEWSATVATEDSAIPVMIPGVMFYNMGLKIGDLLTAQAAGQTITLQVVAMWQPLNANDPAWIFPPKFFDNVLLLRADDLWTLLEGSERPIDEVGWQVIFDGSQLRSSEINALLDRIVVGEREINNTLPGIRQGTTQDNQPTPAQGLTAFNAEVSQLTRQLFIIVAPVGGLVFYFVAMVAGLLVSRQGLDDVKLRSRGMSRAALLTIHILMWLLIVGAALGISMVLAPQVVQLVGQTESFLRFDPETPPLKIVFTQQALTIGAITGLIAASSGLLLAWRSTGQNINSFRQNTMRSGKAWWQRMYLDILMMIPGLYALYDLQGGLEASVEEPFSDPLTFIAPTLLALGFTLLFVRLLPMGLNLIAQFLNLTRSVTLLMALRELTRSMGNYRGALMMVSFTLSLTGFTASMASTLDRSLEDTIQYQVGAEMVLVVSAEAETEQSQSDTGQTTYTVTGYNIPPIQDLQGVEGIESMARIGRYDGRLALRSRTLDGTILAVDRWALPYVTYFREDYAAEDLSLLMNKIALQRTGIILSRQTAEAYDLVIGQEVEMQVDALGEWYDIRVPIIDLIDYFPTLAPSQDRFFLITNLDPIFELAGSPLPFNVWVRLQPGYSIEEVQANIRASGFPVIDWEIPAAEMEAARAEPGRRGVLGFLSVGFVASITLTLIAAIIQSVASFRAQAMQLGVLRAMGLSGSSVGTYLILFQSIAAISGIVSGTLIGLATTLLFLPLLDFSGGLPPYLIRVAWGEITLVYLVFAGMFFGVTMLTTLLMGRSRMSTVLRLGEI